MFLLGFAHLGLIPPFILFLPVVQLCLKLMILYIYIKTISNFGRCTSILSCFVPASLCLNRPPSSFPSVSVFVRLSVCLSERRRVSPPCCNDRLCDRGASENTCRKANSLREDSSANKEETSMPKSKCVCREGGGVEMKERAFEVCA